MKEKHQHIITLLPEYIEGTLDPKDFNEVTEHLKTCAECRKELEALKTLSQAFKDEPMLFPSKNLQQTFLQQLAQEKQGQNKVKVISKSKNTLGFNHFLKIAASIALLAGAFFMGSYWQTEKSEVRFVSLEQRNLEFKQMAMLSMIENTSARKRIEGVNFIEEFQNPDETVINALADRMRFDKNTNVRLTAVEALSRFITSSTVKNAFIIALETEKNPSVQIAIIQNLVKIEEKRARTPMKKLLEQEDTQPFIKNEIHQILAKTL